MARTRCRLVPMRPCLLLGLLLMVPLARAGEEPLTLDRTIPMEGVRGRIDHMALSPDGDRLAVAALGNNSVEIVDLRENRVIHRVLAFPTPTGVVWKEQLAVASGGDGKLHFFDGTTFKETHAVEVGDDADNARADDACQYVGVGDGAIAAVENGELKFKIPLVAHPEAFELEAKGPRLFVNVPDEHIVAVADRSTHRVVAAWQIEKARANYPMALDEEHGRLFVGCRAPARLLVLDTADGGVKASVDLSRDVDDLFLDTATHRIYASCGEGYVDVIAQHDKDRYERITRVPTAPGARTCLFDAKGRRLLVAVPVHPGTTAEIRVFRTPPGAPPD
jgi:DNA-binding beta-propeller fold protein YncE